MGGVDMTPAYLSRDLAPYVPKTLDCREMPCNTKNEEEPPKAGEPGITSRENEREKTCRDDQYKTVCSPQDSAVVAPHPDSLGLCPEV